MRTPKAAATLREARHDPARPAYTLAMADFRPKLKVDQPGDVYEQEAGEIADRVMRRSAGEASGWTQTVVQVAPHPPALFVGQVRARGE